MVAYDGLIDDSLYNPNEGGRQVYLPENDQTLFRNQMRLTLSQIEAFEELTKELQEDSDDDSA